LELGKSRVNISPEVFMKMLKSDWFQLIYVVVMRKMAVAVIKYVSCHFSLSPSIWTKLSRSF
jgi:hypothetical protein